MRKLIIIFILFPSISLGQTLIADTVFAIRTTGGTGTWTLIIDTVRYVTYRNDATTITVSPTRMLNALNSKITSGSTSAGAVSQLTNKSNAVTLNTLSGKITMMNSALAAGAEISFTLNNSFISAIDVVIVNIQSVGTVNSYLVSVSAVANGSCSITISNVSTGSLSQAVALNFLILK